MDVDAAEEVEMETEEPCAAATIPFQLQLDKAIPSQVKIAEWNPEKDLLAMVTDDPKIVLHRFNWQRLWTVSPGKSVTSLCWRPDGRMIAVGLEDGSITLHDVENGKLLRSLKSHSVAVVCLNWEEDAQPVGSEDCISSYEDRTPRFFPPAPRIPRMPGLSSGDAGVADDAEDTFGELSHNSHKRFNLLCSGDKDGNICFSIFGIFPIGKVNICSLAVSTSSIGDVYTHHLMNASLHKLSLSKNLCQLTVLTFGELLQDDDAKCETPCKQDTTLLKAMPMHARNGLVGLHCLLLDTSIFCNRKNELYQVALQASSIEDLSEVIRASLTVMRKQWCDAMNALYEKFNSLVSLISDHGIDSNPQEEFLSLLLGARISPPLHQFLVNSLGEAGLKRVNKTIDSAGKELHTIIREHLLPAAEIMGFRIGELRGLSRWRARYQSIGLDEKLIENLTEKAGMFLVQVERFLRVLAILTHEFQNFFIWLMRSIKLLMSEPAALLSVPNSELVIIFLKFHYNCDPISQLLEASEMNHDIEVDVDTMQRIEELVSFGGFVDTGYLKRTLAKEFFELEHSLKEAFSMPFATISKRICCEDLLPLYPISSLHDVATMHAPISVSYCKDGLADDSTLGISGQSLMDYICFKIPDESFNLKNSIGIAKGFTTYSGSAFDGVASLEALIIHIPVAYTCVDLSFYKDGQVVLLLNETATSSESPGKSYMMMFQTCDFPFVSIANRSSPPNFWKLRELKAFVLDLEMGLGKLRSIAHSLSPPLAVSASRGVACVFSARRRALVYILDEDEDEATDTEWRRNGVLHKDYLFCYPCCLKFRADGMRGQKNQDFSNSTSWEGQETR